MSQFWNQAPCSPVPSKPHLESREIGGREGPARSPPLRRWMVPSPVCQQRDGAEVKRQLWRLGRKICGISFCCFTAFFFFFFLNIVPQLPPGGGKAGRAPVAPWTALPWSPTCWISAWCLLCLVRGLRVPGGPWSSHCTVVALQQLKLTLVELIWICSRIVGRIIWSKIASLLPPMAQLIGCSAWF